MYDLDKDFHIDSILEMIHWYYVWYPIGIGYRIMISPSWIGSKAITSESTVRKWYCPKGSFMSGDLLPERAHMIDDLPHER